VFLCTFNPAIYADQYNHALSFQTKVFLQSARRAGCQNAVALLGISAAVDDIGVRVASIPHHHTTKGRVALGVSNEASQVGRCDVVLCAATVTIGAQGRGGHTDKDFGVLGWSAGKVFGPGIVVEGSTAVESQGARVGCVSVVVIELNPEVIKGRVADDLSHVGFRDRALRSTGDVVALARVGSEVGAQLGNHVLEVLVAFVALDIKVPAVHGGIAKGMGHRGVSGTTIRFPEVLADSLSFRLGSQRVRGRGASQRQNDLDTSGLALGDGRGDIVALLGLASGADEAGLADDA
jgi:hypothetical protein